MKKYFLKTTLKVLVLLTIFILVVYSIYDIKKTTNFTTDVEKGQLWVKVLMEKNPYSDSVCDTIQVIDVNEKFALIKYHGDTVVWETDVVKYNRKLINKK